MAYWKGLRRPVFYYLDSTDSRKMTRCRISRDLAYVLRRLLCKSSLSSSPVFLNAVICVPRGTGTRAHSRIPTDCQLSF